MYWQDTYQSPSHAVRALQLAVSGKVRMTPTQLHIAHVAARSGLSGLTEPAVNLAGLKKDIKKALKSNDAAKIASVMAREQAKIDKAPASKKAPKRVDYVNQLQARLTAVSVPATPILPGAPEQPIPQLPATDAYSFSQGSNNSGTSFTTPEPIAPVAEGAQSWLTMPVMIGIGAAGLLALYLLTRKR